MTGTPMRASLTPDAATASLRRQRIEQPDSFEDGLRR